MTLDTVISGCVVYFLDSQGGLDQQRVGMLEDCLGELDVLVPHVPEDAAGYFERLRVLAGLLLEAHRR